MFELRCLGEAQRKVTRDRLRSEYNSEANDLSKYENLELQLRIIDEMTLERSQGPASNFVNLFSNSFGRVLLADNKRKLEKAQREQISLCKLSKTYINWPEPEVPDECM